MLPWKTIIKLDKQADKPVYLQVSNAIIREINRGVLKPNTKMPGTRSLSVQLNLNRQTVVKAYDELYAQEWLVSIQTKGTFVNQHLPVIHPRQLESNPDKNIQAEETGYTFTLNTDIHQPASPNRQIVGFHDGPDVRLIPVEQIARGYKRILQRKSNLTLLSYVEVEGRQSVREAFSDYLNTSRGLQTTYQNIMITRGSQMALFLLAQVLISKGDQIITASIGYRYADLTFMHAKAKLIRVALDENGIDVDHIERICQQTRIRAVYVTSHHHYPTTVTLSAARRMKLLALAEQHNFIIIEDDYDYEFHYESSPILPLASADAKGMVVYIGSFSKTLSPAIRVGYISAPLNLIQEVARIRQIIDAQGDPILEQVVAEMLREGEVGRHMKKALKEYRIRRDFMCELLKQKLGDAIKFKIPEGGLALWASFDKRIKVPLLAKALKQKGVIISNGLIHDASSGRTLNSTRMGFGWMNMQEAEHSIETLREVVG